MLHVCLIIDYADYLPCFSLLTSTPIKLIFPVHIPIPPMWSKAIRFSSTLHEMPKLILSFRLLHRKIRMGKRIARKMSGCVVAYFLLRLCARHERLPVTAIGCNAE